MNAAHLDELPQRSLVQVIEKAGEESWAWNYSYFEKYGRKWLELNPSDRFDGEETVESGYLVAKSSGFKNLDPDHSDPDPALGEVRLLFSPE